MLHNVGNIYIDPDRLDSALSQALLFARETRRDDYGLVDEHNAIDAYARHCDGEAMRWLAQTRNWKPSDEMIADAQRHDAMPAGAGAAPRDLEYVRAQVLMEELPALNSELLFPQDTEVPLGVTSHVMERWVTSGEAQIYRGGTSVAVASAAKVEERFGVAYIACGIRQNFFQALSVNYAGLRTFQAESEAALRLVKERMNRINWNGDTGTQLRGVLNYPHLAKAALATPFNLSSSGPAIVAELNTLVGTPRRVSKQVFYPSRLAVSETLHQFLTQTRFEAGHPTTIAEQFLKGQVGKPGGIKEIEAAYELEAGSDEMLAAGAPPAAHGMLAFRGDRTAVRRVTLQEPTWLPMWQSGPFDTQHVIFAAVGGIVMPNSGNNVLGYAFV